MNWIDVSKDYGYIHPNKDDKHWQTKGGAWVYKIPDGSWFGVSFTDRIGLEIDEEDFLSPDDEKFPYDNKQFASAVSYISSKRLFHWKSLQDRIAYIRAAGDECIDRIDAISDPLLQEANWAAMVMFSYNAGGEEEWFFSNSPAIVGADAFRYAENLIANPIALNEQLERHSKFRC